MADVDVPGPPVPLAGKPSFLQRLADGTVKQLNPFTGTRVWTVPARVRRPNPVETAAPRAIVEADLRSACPFCPDRYLETPPEKARLVPGGGADGRIIANNRTDALFDTVAEFRRVPNLFEIMSLDYWRRNYGAGLPEGGRRHMVDYVSTEAGRSHVRGLVERRTGQSWDRMSEADRRDHVEGFFGGGHDVVIARRHYLDGAVDDSQLASAGSLTPDEHERYIRFTIDALPDLYAANQHIRYVAVFQNWLRPAGASFEHLHKQLVAIDEHGAQADLELQRVRANPNCYNEFAVDYAGQHDLIVADNEHAIAFAGFGHRYPTLEIYSKSRQLQPWNHSRSELRAMSDVVHALHAATGAEVPSNEEWHHQPPDAEAPMPWRVLIKWRVSTMAGFEGGTKIYLNTIDPHTLRDRVIASLYRLREEGRIAGSVRVGRECTWVPNCLLYNPALSDRS